MAILKYSEVAPYKGAGHTVRLQELKKSVIANAKPAPRIFLSHRHTDKEWVVPIASYLTSLGVEIYMDWLDPNAPEKTSAETANLIQGKIQQTDKFIVIASPGSLESKWIPWELGYADAFKGKGKVAVLPIGDQDSDWKNREYFQIYSYIEHAQGGTLAVFPPDQDTGTKLTVWFTKK